MSKHCSLQETAALLQAANKIVLCSHVSPDGDTLGSALSLMKALQKLGKDVIVTMKSQRSINFYPVSKALSVFKMMSG
jgi:phosphoesterase RecJ-like protein